jgi:GNAT superfamily N-acetyltransferase
MMKVVIRKAKCIDAIQVINLCKNSIVDEYGHFLTQEAMRPWCEGRKMDNYVKDMIPNMFVAEINQQIVGVVTIEFTLIGLIWVEKEFRRRGVGSLLMRRAEKELVLRGFDLARVECFEPNIVGLSFYESCGWSVHHTRFDDDARVNVVVLKKLL